MSEIPAEAVPSAPAPLKELSGRVMLGVVAGMAVFLGGPAVFFVCFAASDGLMVWQRIVFGLFACLLLALPTRVVGIFLRRRFTKGQWMPTMEERLRLRSKAALRGTPSWMKYSDQSLGAYFLVLASWVGSRYVHSSHRDPINLFLIVIFGVIAALSFWNFYWKYRKSKKADAAV